ncbi:hypothetical protein ACFL22_00925 [Patescibacteria group bacterium]
MTKTCLRIVFKIEVLNFINIPIGKDEKMKKLIVVRHGAYDTGTMNLNGEGHQQISDLVPKICDTIADGTAIILSSTAPRAEQSASILSDELVLAVELHEVLWSENSRPIKPNTVLEIIRSSSIYDVVILVTHLEYTEMLTAYYARQALNIPEIIQHSIEKGEMLILDCEAIVSTHPSTKDSNDTQITSNTAVDYAQRLLEFTSRDVLKKVWLFGSTVTRGHGNDMDLILEVPENIFLEYTNACIGALDGYHPIKMALLQGCSMYWDYHSPQTARIMNAFEAIGITESELDRLSEIVENPKADVVCLPVGWDTEGTYVNTLLQKNFGFGNDPDLLDNILKTSVEVTNIDKNIQFPTHKTQDDTHTTDDELREDEIPF